MFTWQVDALEAARQRVLELWAKPAGASDAQPSRMYVGWQVPSQAGGNSKLLWADHTAR